MPQANDPTNNLGNSINSYGFVNSQVTITASSQRTSNLGPQSLGQTCGINAQTCPPAPTIDPNVLHGTSYLVDSSFDVHFDMQLTDVDSSPGRDYAGQPDGASFILQDVTMLNMQSFSNAVFDKNEESFDLLMPPQSDVYFGIPVDVPLGADINGNGTNDKLRFTQFLYGVQSGNRLDMTLLTNLLWNHEYDSAALLGGLVENVTGGVPFQIGAQLPNGQPDPAAFGGRDLVESRLVNPIVPEPITVLLSVLGVVAVSLKRRRNKIVHASIRPEGAVTC